jgi:cyclophilin family peptidyl-prolyl cis-trans isomerase
MKCLAVPAVLVLLCLAQVPVSMQEDAPAERPGVFTLLSSGLAVEVRTFTQSDRVGFEFHIGAPLQPDDTRANLGVYISRGEGQLRYFGYSPCERGTRRTALRIEGEDWLVDDEAEPGLAGIVVSQSPEKWVGALLLDPTVLGSTITATWRVGFLVTTDAVSAYSGYSLDDLDSLAQVALQKAESRDGKGSETARSALESEHRALKELSGLTEIQDAAKRIARIKAALKHDPLDPTLLAELVTETRYDAEVLAGSLDAALSASPGWYGAHDLRIQSFLARNGPAAAADYFLTWCERLPASHSRGCRGLYATGWNALVAARRYEELSLQLGKLKGDDFTFSGFALELKVCATLLLRAGQEAMALNLRDRMIEADERAVLTPGIRAWWFESLVESGRFSAALAEFQLLKQDEAVMKEHKRVLGAGCIHAIGGEYDPPAAIEECSKLAKAGEALLPKDMLDGLASYSADCTTAIESWEAEQEFREQDAAKSNPRVRMQTDQGEVLIELFEDDAPNTVANFVKLAKDGFYDGRAIYRREEGWLVQGGGTDDDPSGKLDWSIKNEDNRRQHWRGTIAMARTRDKDSADTHFFITIGNHPASLGLSTDWVVFGRIIEGLPNAQRLQEGDRFTKVTVEKLRDHAYVPVRTPVEDH